MARWPVVALFVLGLGCGSEMRKTDEPRGGSEVAAATDAGMMVVDPTRPEVTERPARGAPHYAVVQATAISLGGTAALSRDAQGEIRVWPALDGSVAPRAVAVRGVLAMRVQDRSDEILAGFAESSGSGHLVRINRKGERFGVAEVTGPGTVLQVSPLADASGALALFADHSIAWIGLDGAPIDFLTRRGTRVRALEVTGPTTAYAVLRASEGDGTVTHSVARLEIAGGKLKVAAEVALPLEPLEPMRFAVSHDGRRIAYSRDPDEAKARVAPPEAERAARRPSGGAGAPMPSDLPARRPPPPRGVALQARIAVIDTVSGADVTPAELKEQLFSDVSALGFSSPDRLHVFDAANQVDIRLTDGVAIAGRMPRSGGVSIADGLLLTGFDVSLVLQSPDGDTRYLGWQTNVPQRVAMSSDGARAAWASQRGELMIEALDGSQEIYGGLYEAPINLLSFVGRDHVVIGSGRGTLHLVDARTGKEQGSLAPPGPLNNVDIDGDSGWIAGTRTGGGVWMVKIDPTSAMPSTTMVVADGSGQFGMRTDGKGGDPELITIDSAQVMRRYTTAELKAGVSAKQIRDRATTKLPKAMSRIDRRGRTYVFEGRKLVIYADGIVETTHTLGFDPVDLAVSTDGEVLIVFDRQNALTRIGADGKPLWTATMGPGGRWASAFSSDGKRLGAVGSAGGVVFDTATGERVTTSCAWRFGATAAPPLSRAVGVAPICQ